MDRKAATSLRAACEAACIHNGRIVIQEPLCKLRVRKSLRATADAAYKQKGRITIREPLSRLRARRREEGINIVDFVKQNDSSRAKVKDDSTTNVDVVNRHTPTVANPHFILCKDKLDYESGYESDDESFVLPLPGGIDRTTTEKSVEKSSFWECDLARRKRAAFCEIDITDSDSLEETPVTAPTGNFGFAHVVHDLGDVVVDSMYFFHRLKDCLEDEAKRRFDLAPESCTADTVLNGKTGRRWCQPVHALETVCTADTVLNGKTGRLWCQPVHALGTVCALNFWQNVVASFITGSQSRRTGEP